MIPYFRPLTLVNKILRVDDNNFVELTGVASMNGVPRNTYIFDAKFKIKVDDQFVNPRDYSKVIVTVRRKNSPSPIAEDIRKNLTSSNILGSVNDRIIRLASDSFTPQVVSEPINSQNLNKKFGLKLPAYPSTLEKRLYSGIQIVEDSKIVDESIAKKEVLLSFTDLELNSLYKVTDVIEDTSSIPTNFDPPVVFIQPNYLLPDINREMTDITHPISDPVYSNLSSPLDAKLVDQYAVRSLQKKKNSLYAGLVKYYLDESDRRSDEDRIKRYKTNDRIQKASVLDFQTTFRVGKGLLGEVLEIKFDLYRKGSNVPSETITKEFDVLSHVEAFESIKKPPVVTASSFYSGWMNSVNLTIVDQESFGKITKFNVYVKDINKFGEAFPYRFVGETTGNSVTNTVIFNASSNLMSIRVVPIGTLGTESNVYTNIMFGEGYSSIGNLSMTATRLSAGNSVHSRVLITVYNIPKETIRLDFFRRPHEQRQIDSRFSLIGSYDNRTGDYTSKTYEFVDRDSDIPNFPEYFVQAVLSYGETISTNPRIVNNSIPVNSLDVTVTINNLKKLKKDEDYVTSFDLNTIVSKNENQRLIDFFKDDPKQKELYDQLVSANNNNLSAVDQGDRVTPLYSDLYVHEVVRTDLNTDEVSTFEVVTNNFEDSHETRSPRGIKPLNPQHAYVYQVFTYAKDPRTLFKNYVKRSVGLNGEIYYYQPYKWDNNGFNRIRTMPDTDGNDLPIISGYDNLTANPLGQKALIKIEGMGEFVSVNEVNHQRIDRNTIKVIWTCNTPDYTSYYDSFIVMKTVNGKRSFVGRTRFNYIYHELTAKDVGNIYYTVVPITSEFDIDNSAHSNPFLLDTSGLIDPQLLGVW